MDNINIDEVLEQEDMSKNQEIAPKRTFVKKVSGFLEEILYKRDNQFKLLFLAAFALGAAPIIQGILLYIMKRPLPEFMKHLSVVISFFCFVPIIFLYFSRTSTARDGNVKRPPVQILPVFAAYFLILLIGLFCFTNFNVFWNELMLKSGAGSNGTAAASVTGVRFVIMFILQLAMLASVVLLTAWFEYLPGSDGLGWFTLVVLKSFLNKFFLIIICDLILWILILFEHYAVNAVKGFIYLQFPESFAGNFIFCTLNALFISYFLYVLINISRLTLAGLDKNSFAGNVQNGGGVAARPTAFLFPAVLLAMLVILFVLSGAMGLNVIDRYKADIRLSILLGNAFIDRSRIQGAIYEYDKAYSQILALKGYLQGLQSLKDKNKNLEGEAYNNLKAASSLDPKNMYVPYFTANLYFDLADGNDAGKLTAATEQYKIASKYEDAIPEAYFGLLKIYALQGDETKVRDIVNLLIAGDTYSDRFSYYEGLDSGRLIMHIKELEKLEEELIPKLIYKPMEKALYNDYQSALDELVTLQKQNPKEPVINYFASIIADKYKNEQNNYPLVKDFAHQYDSSLNASGSDFMEKFKKMFMAQMAFKANDPVLAEDILKYLHNKYSDDTDIGEKYAYMLVRNKNWEEAVRMADEVIKADPENVPARYDRAMACLSRKDYRASLENMRDYLKLIGAYNKPEPGNIRAAAYDENLYAYSLAFSRVIDDKEASTQLEGFKDDPLLYNYLYGIKAWKYHDNAKAREYLLKTIDEAGNLGYALYIIGVNYFEETVRTGGSDFSNSAGYLLRSLKLQPDHAEAYFALGHCYKKWGKGREALRAFRRVIDLVPYQDHRTDPYGISAHSMQEIQNLRQYDTEEGD